MNRIFTMMIVCVVALVSHAKSTRMLRVDDISGNAYMIPYSDIKEAHFDDPYMIINTNYGEFNLATNDVATFYEQPTDNPLQVTINYDTQGVKFINALAYRGVTVSIDGGNVSIDNPIEGEEITVTLTGSHTDGSLTYTGSYKMTLVLDNLSLTSTQGAAIDIKCGKRIAVVLPEGSVNSLIDAAGGEQKAAMYFKGHPEFEGKGLLYVTGNTNHAIAAKEYIQFKKSVGAINVLYAANDGIHAGQYFQMNGGKLSIANVAGDGVQAEVTDDDTDENNGQMIIKGGEINITVTGSTADCLKADSLITISGGILNLTTTGNGIEDTNTTFYGPGGGGWPGGPGGGWPGGPGGPGGSKVETSTPKCINGGWDITITGGTITALSTGKGGKCIVADGTLIVGGNDSSPEVKCSTTGTAVAGSGENLSGQPKAIKVEGDIIIESGLVHCTTSNNGGEGIESKGAITFNGGTVICNTYDDGINASKKITVNGGIIWSWSSGNDGMDCNGSQGFEFNGGIIVSNGTRAPEEGFDCDNYAFVINGGTALGVGGATSNVTKATQPYAQTTGVQVTQNKYLSICDASGNVLLSYLCPVTLSSATIVSTSPQYGNNSSCKIVYGVTAVNNPEQSYIDGRILIGGTLSGGTSKNITPKTK